MTSRVTTATASAAVHPGTWQLADKRAMSLRPRRPFVLSVAQGRLWATLDGPHRGSPAGLGDHVLEAGDSLTVAPGRRLVVETWGGPACFGWDPAPEVRTVAVRAAIAEPLADLRQALGLAVGAAGRLATALLGWRPEGRADNRRHGASEVFTA